MARILLIEDSPTEAAVLAQLLERNGHQVTTSGNAEDGIASCKRDKPDLVLMDADTSHIPVLIVSTKNLETDKMWGLRQGAKDYIVKPPRESDLIERINALVGH